MLNSIVFCRLGEKAMTYLLKNTSIFIYLSNNSYLQVTGKKVQLSNYTKLYEINN